MLQRLIKSSVSLNRRLAHTLPDLPYEYNALEPIISADTLRVHHSKHHATYVNNYNAAEEKLKKAIAKGDINGIVTAQNALAFNGGGHVNHSIYWTSLSPRGGGTPKGDIYDAISSKYGSFDNFREHLSAICIAVQGSGWGWLGYDPRTRLLDISTTSNQELLTPTSGGIIPLLTIDVWEHAYYLQYKNARADYVKAIWNIIDWEKVTERYHTAKMKFS